MKNNKFLKFLSTVLVAILIITIAPMNETVVNGMKSSANSVVKAIGEAVEKIDFTLPEINLKAEAANYCTYSWNNRTQTLTVTGSGNMPDYKKSAAPWDNYKKAKKLIVSGDITSIGLNAFKGFELLENVVIEAPVTYINGYAFQNCVSLSNISFPDTLKSIYGSVFDNCKNLKEVVLPDSVTAVYGSFAGCDLEKLTTPFVGGGPDNNSSRKTNQLGYMFGTTERENTYSMKSTADKTVSFYVPYSLKSVTITKSMYKYGLRHCVGIEKIVLANTVATKTIPYDFAYGCFGLKEIIINSENITAIDKDAFRNCTALESLEIPESIKSIGEYAFSGCTALCDLSFSKTDFVADKTAFKDTAFISNSTDEFVIVGDGVLILYNGTSKDVAVPDGVKRINSGAFNGRSDITSVTIPDTLLYLSADSFYGCSGITELTIPETINRIEKEALSGMCNLRKLTVSFLGESPEAQSGTDKASMGYWFEQSDSGCSFCENELCKSYSASNINSKVSLSKNFYYLYIEGGIIHSNCLRGLKVPRVILQAGVEGIEENGLAYAGINELVFGSGYNPVEFPDGAFSGNNIKAVDIPDSIKRLGACFTNNPLETVYLNSGLKVIDGTFYKTNLKKVSLPNLLEKILGGAFASCSKLSTVSIPQYVDEISPSAFSNNSATKFSVNKNNEHYYAKNGVLYSKAGVLIAYPGKSTETVFRVRAEVTDIPTSVLSSMKRISCFVADADNPYYHACDGVLYTKDGVYVQYPVEKESDTFIMDEVVSSVPYDVLKQSQFKAYEVAEDNQHYYSCDGVLYTEAGTFLLYPSKKTDTTYIVGSQVRCVPPQDSAVIAHIAAVEVAEDNPEYASVDGVLYNKDITDIIWYPQKKEGDYTAPDTVNNVSYYSFYKANIGKLEFPNDIHFENDCFHKADMEELIVVNLRWALYYYFGYEYRVYQAFTPDSLKKIVLTNQTSDLANYFAMSFEFDEIEINGSFTHIGDDAFNITFCEEIRLPDTVEYIGDRSFSQSNFEKIYLGKSLKHIGERAFDASHYLRYIKLPKTVEYIGTCAFASTAITEIILWDNVTHVGTQAFEQSKLKRAVISENLADMADEIFIGCSDLQFVIIGGFVKVIGKKTFADCSSLESVVIPDSVTNISDSAFQGANEDLVIYCNEGSYAQQYAVANDIKYTTLVIDPIENQIYTGEEIKPEVNASANNRKLTQNSEYTVSYKDNINAGSAKVIAKGLGDFKHLAATAKFTILPRGADKVRAIDSGSVYNPKGVKPEIYVFSGSKRLVEGTDYEILDNPVLTDAGEYNIAVSLIGNYDGVVNATYKISRKAIAKTDIDYDNGVKITYKGETLEEGKDYTVTKETKENGDIVTKVEGIGNYCGTDSYTQKNSNNQASFGWFENFINAIKQLFEKLFNIGV